MYILILFPFKRLLPVQYQYQVTYSYSFNLYICVQAYLSLIHILYYSLFANIAFICYILFYLLKSFVYEMHINLYKPIFQRVPQFKCCLLIVIMNSYSQQKKTERTKYVLPKAHF